MKIKGPGPKGPANVADVDATKDIKSKGKSGTFAEKLGHTNKAGATDAAKAPLAQDPVASVAIDLKAGKITPQQAVEKLAQMAVNDGPAKNLPDKVKAKIQADLQDLVKEDPYLQSRARRVGVLSDE